MARIMDCKAPIPQLDRGITINRGDGNKVLYTIYPHYDSERGYTTSPRVVIGRAINSKELIPNRNYRKYFPELWKEVSDEDVPAVTKKAGLFALVSTITQREGIRDILEKTFGISRTNAMLDYVTYSLGYHSNVAMNYKSTMQEHVLFSDKLHDDGYYSSLFTHDITETEINMFRIRWAQHCAAQGMTSVYLAIDGSNDDCNSKGVEFAEKGAAKSHINTDVVGFMYAVEPRSGKVVTFDTYRGGLVDSKAMLRIITFLSENSISVRGVIIDRGFCDGKCLQFLRSRNIPYVLMMKDNTDGHKYMMAMHGDELRWNSEAWIPGTFLFSTSEYARLFKNSAITAQLHLYYDFRNGDERCETLLGKISKAIAKLNEGKGIPAELSDIITMREDGPKKYDLQREAFRNALSSKGFYTIASSENTDGGTIHEMYSSRDSAETEFMYVKGQLGYGTVRVQSNACMLSRFLIGAICATVREDVENCCKKLGLKTNTMLNEFRQLSITCYNTKNYTMVHTEKINVKSLMSELGMTPSDLDDIATFETKRLNGEVTPVIRRKKPGPKKGSHHVRLDENGQVIKRKPGPKPGSHHKTKYNKDGSVRKKPGPKPGSHHKKKAE